MLLKSIHTIVALLLSVAMMAQGINFETGTWKEAVEKAKKENKLIYLDVYAEWCGPCKMMAKNVFPDPRAGEKYNKYFINVKIDAEKGEGRDVARQYGVSSYPTNLYINPHNEKPVYRIAGACGVDEFIKRAEIAQLDFSDPMSWADYQKKLKTDYKDFQYLQTYISKAQRIGEFYDNAIDLYVDHHLSNPPNDTQFIFLLNAVQNLDNKGYAILDKYRAHTDSMVSDPRYFLAEREKTTLLNNTFKKAVETKDIKVMHSSKPVLNKYNTFDSTGKWLSIENQFYRTLQDEKNLYKNYLNTISYYEKIAEKERITRDEKAFQENIKIIKANPKFAHQKQEAIDKEVSNQIKRNLAFKYPLTANQINAYINAADYTLNIKNPSTKQIKSAYNWLEKAEKIIPEQSIEYIDRILDLKAKSRYLSKDIKGAIEITNKRIETLKERKFPTTNAEEMLKKIENGTLMAQ